jgi:hypothetical protein
MKKLVIAALALLTAVPASAHVVWIERPSADTARAYFGEMISRREKTGELLDKIQPVIFADPAVPLPQTRGADYIEVKAGGDIRLADERYPPFGEGTSGVMRPMMYARWGRTDTNARMAFEFVPDALGSDGFTLILQGKPAAGSKVVLIDPDGLDTKYETDAKGHVTISPEGSGQFILRASVMDRTPGESGGTHFDFTARVTTLTFTRP